MAVLALVLFPIIALFIGQKPKRPVEGALVVFFVATMFLPEATNIDFPLIPAIGKHELASGMGLVVLYRRNRQVFRTVKPFRGLELVFLVTFAVSFLQVPDNRDPIIWPQWTGVDMVMDGLTFKDGISTFLARLLAYWMPFYLGRVAVTSAQDLRAFLRLVVIFGFVYSICSTIEQIMSPQLHSWVYGYHAHRDFMQCRRMGGWRPMIFMYHGLTVALFMLMVASASITLYRVKEKALKYAPRTLAIYQTVHVLLMKSTGAIAFGAFLLPVTAFASPRTQMRICLVFAVLCTAYPLSKVVDVFPREQIEHVVASVFNAERASSLGDRFRNDAVIGERAHERFWFGWGSGYMRMEIFNIWGKKVTVPDAQWIILFGSTGFAGLSAFLTVCLWPVFAASRALRKITDPDSRILLTGTALLVITYTFDMMLNSMQNGLSLLLPGALYGAGQALVLERGRSRAYPAGVPVPRRNAPTPRRPATV